MLFYVHRREKIPGYSHFKWRIDDRSSHVISEEYLRFPGDPMLTSDQLVVICFLIFLVWLCSEHVHAVKRFFFDLRQFLLKVLPFFVYPPSLPFSLRPSVGPSVLTLTLP